MSDQLKNLEAHFIARDVPYEYRFHMEKRLEVGQFTFLPLISKDSGKLIELNIRFLTDNEPGHGHSHTTGDIDNLTKSLIDGMRSPNSFNEVRNFKKLPRDDIIYSLMEDDCLVRKLDVTHEKLLVNVPKTKGKRDLIAIVGIKVVPKYC